MTDAAFEVRLRTLEMDGAAIAVHNKNIHSRLCSIEDTLKWLVRLIMGSLIAGVISGAFAIFLSAPFSGV